MSALNWKSVVSGVDAKAASKATPRERFVANLKAQAAMHKDPKVEGKRQFEVKGDQVIFTPRLGNMAVELLPGKRTVAVAAKDFAAVIDAIVVDVEKAEFDKQLNEIAANYAKRRKPVAAGK